MGNDNVKDDIMVSVYCTAYNHGKYIRQTLEGFVRQKTDFKYEIIIHDDASTDNTAAIIKEYEEKYPKLIRAVYQTENQYSKGINIFDEFIAPLFRGKYVAVCEGDDYWTDGKKLQMQVDFLEQHEEYSACVHQTVILNCKTGKKKLLSPYNRDCDVEIKNLITDGGGKAYHFSALMYRAKYACNRPDFFYIINSIQDFQTGIYLGIVGKIFFMNRIMSVYRQFSLESSWSSEVSNDVSKNISANEGLIEVLKSVDKYTRGKYHKYVDRACSRFEYENKRLKNDREIIKNPRYKRWFKQESVANKVYILARLYIPEKIWRCILCLKKSRS